MGITIHYKGKAKSREAIDELISELINVAQEFQWKYEIIEEQVHGPFSPFWGIVYNFIPTREMILQSKIEYFPKMVTAKNTGYYRISDTSYADHVRRSFRMGKYPRFKVDAVQKGIRIQVHPDCEPINFIFDLNTLIMVHYEKNPAHGNLIFGFEHHSCKTQYAGFAAHAVVCQLIWWAEKYVLFTDVYDEADYYESKDETKAQQTFQRMGQLIEEFGDYLKKVGEKLGFNVTVNIPKQKEE